MENSTNSINSYNHSLKEYEFKERQLTDKLLKNFNNIEQYKLINARLCYDFWMQIKGQIYLGEVKVRNFTIDKYDNYFIETEKLNNLLMSAKIKNLGIVYVNYFKTDSPENWNWILFNLRERANKWNKDNIPSVEFIEMNDRTFVSTENKRHKLIIRLKFDPQIDRKGTLILN